MNMFRNLLTVALLGLAVGLVFGQPEQWAWIQRLGPDASDALKLAITFRPFVVGACVISAVALFMTRKQY